MAGHSKWKNIQHRKGAQDAKKGKAFTKVIKEIAVAVKIGGPDIESNPRLRSAVAAARSVNMPRDNIDRAIKKASGNDGTTFNEITYEGFAPGGVGIFIECATDNQTRTISNIRSYFNKHGGNLGQDGCLQFIFERKGIFLLPDEGIDEEEFTMEMIDARASDVEFEDGQITVTSEMEDFGNVQKKFRELGLEPQEAGLQRIPLDSKKIDIETYKKVMKLIDKLEEDDDVQKVYHNIEYSDELANL